MAKLVECVPNFSCSRERDPAAFRALEETAQTVPGCTLLDVHSDGSHNRCVLTLIGSSEAVGEAAFRLAQTAVQVIDLTRHTGAHPRMGAVDVIPLVPMGDTAMEECIALSKALGRRLWEELELPSFLYEQSASRPERRNLADCRRGQFEGMGEKLLRPEWAPDFGARRVHPTAGIVAVGARPPLVAFNVNLSTADVEVAKKIARAIRGSSGGFQCCKALGLFLEDRGIAQVSMNLVDYRVTPLNLVFEMIRALAERYGAHIVSSELVGLTPAKTLLDCAEHYLKLENFNCQSQVIEYRLLEME